eukprot:scaffold7228_cov523-Prasinococcus_capsulatus_cf.AAC.14
MKHQQSTVSLDYGPESEISRVAAMYRRPDSLLDCMEPIDETVPSQTKIVCTLGPMSREVPVLEDLLRAGMSIARFNFSHGSHEYHQETLDNLRVAMRNTGKLCGVLLDTKGPEIRTGFLEGGEAVQLVRDSEITLTTDYSIKGNATLLSCSYPHLARDMKPGDKILCADGSAIFTVLSADEGATSIRVRCENNAKLGERKNMNLPGVKVDLPTLTEKDIDDIQNWGLKNDIDFVAASFVRKGSDLDTIRQVLGEKGKYVQIISKVENQEGLENFDDILEKSDGIMVARGDLGMEIPLETIFMAQNIQIKKCNLAGKPVVTATQMLESMVNNPRPTRAEATDVANAVLDGSDCVMLSGETAAGGYPVEAVTIMSRICKRAEAFFNNHNAFNEVVARQGLPMHTMESLASSAVRTADKVHATLIVVLTSTGSTARLVAKYRPRVPVLAVCIDAPGKARALVTCSKLSVVRSLLADTTLGHKEFD